MIAAVPLVLGFTPEQSVVMLTFGAEHTFHARVDLAEDDADVPDLVAALLGPALVHGVRRVVFVFFAGDHDLAREVFASLEDAFEFDGIEIVDAFRADGRHWFPLAHELTGQRPLGRPYDLASHRFTAASVLQGQVTQQTRGELAAGLDPQPTQVRATSRALADLAPAQPSRVEAAWAAELVEEHVATGTPLDVGQAARLLRALRQLPVRDEVWSGTSRVTARDHVRFWTDLVRRAPEEFVATPAALLGFTAWLAGQGALAWCAVDRCRAVAPEHGLARLVADALVHAAPPALWEGPFRTGEPA